MKKLLSPATFLILLSLPGFGQQGNGNGVFDKANSAVNKISNAIAVFQPYLLKARQLYYDAKQAASDFRRDAKGVFHKDSTGNNGYNTNGTYSGNSNYPNTTSYSDNNSNSTPYLQGQSLPVNNPTSINDDATGNWGNQNSGLYGNCLDVLTGTVMGMGEAAQSPGSVDLLFFAPDDGQNTYVLMTPGFARNNSTATYMTQGVSDQVQKWSDANESEVALTRITLGQFNQMQNNSQIQNAARNARDYAGYYTAVGQKLDGQVFAVRVTAENREVYALVAVIKQFGTSGSNGYLKIKIKSTGIDANHDGQVDANAYLRK